MKQSSFLSLSKEISKATICPLSYLITLVIGETSIIPFMDDSPKNALEAGKAMTVSSDLVTAAFFLFIFLSIISLIGFKLTKRFHYLENNWFLFGWGIVMGIVSMIVLGDMQAGPFATLMHFLF